MEVTLNPTPSQELVAKAVTEVTVTDARGRSIVLKKPGILAQFRMVEALGDAASNRTYANMVMPLIYVSSIDGDAVFAPQRKSEIEALIQRLDEPGLNAVLEGIAANFGETDPAKDKAAVKN